MAHIQLCSSYFQAGDLAGAAECSRDFTTRFSEIAEAWLARGQALLAFGRLDDADVLAEEMAERFPEDPVALDLRARVLLGMGRLDEARSVALRIVEVFPESPRGYNLLAATLVRIGKVKEAVKVQEKGFTQGGSDPETLYCSAQVFARGGRHVQAEEAKGRLDALGLAQFIDTAPMGLRKDKLIWLKEGMSLYPDPE